MKQRNMEIGPSSRQPYFDLRFEVALSITGGTALHGLGSEVTF
jgi:hypothetical protein